jgi:hypothetical protein
MQKSTLTLKKTVQTTKKKTSTYPLQKLFTNVGGKNSVFKCGLLSEIRGFVVWHKFAPVLELFTAFIIRAIHGDVGSEQLISIGKFLIYCRTHHPRAHLPTYTLAAV